MELDDSRHGAFNMRHNFFKNFWREPTMDEFVWADQPTGHDVWLGKAHAGSPAH